jgi:DNA-binding LytR/AlgR family response regulator
MLTALMIDDEPLARARLRRLLKSQGVQVLGEAEDAAEGLQQVQDLKPDLLFLDIQMPDLSGMQAAATLLHLKTAPLLIFVTGYSEYAITAFELNALDYLLKPISVERLALTLARAREHLANRQGQAQAVSPIEVAAPSLSRLRSLPVRTDYTVRFLPLDEILGFISRQRQVFVLTRSREYRLNYTLTQLEALLPAERFLRIHDSSLVNIDAVVELLFLGDHTYEIRLSNNQLLRVGRTRYPELQRRMGLRDHPTATFSPGDEDRIRMGENRSNPARIVGSQ